MKTMLILRSTSSMNAAFTKLALFSTLFAACGLLAADLEQGFRQPPDSARPWVWWFWLNNNVTKETITSDLEQYKAKGIGGVTVYSLGALKGRVASGSSFMSPAWRELFRHTVREADRLGLGVSVMPCAGWNAAGPWISADNACKRFVQSKLTIRGPLKFAEKLPQPQVLEKYWDVNVQAFPAQPPVTAGNPDPVRTRLLAMKSAQDSAGPTPKTPFRHLWEAPLAELPPAPGESPIVPADVIDLTARLAPDGTLTWEVPEGEWTILRTGCTLTGQRNLCVGPGDEGWDADPLRAAAIETHFKNTSEILLADAGDLAGKTLRSLQIDSWEIKIPNWSQTFLAEFQRFRGYDARPYLAALAGCTVGSAEITDRFLHDYRKTLGDCVAENYFGRFTTLARARNVLNQSEAGGPCYPQTMPMDFLKNLGRCDIPMGEFWQSETWGANGPILNGKQTASAAHTYGKRLAAAEAFGSFGRTWGDSPASLKPTGDQAFCEGLNWFFIFSTATQPGAGTPGVEFHAGTHFNQNTTWWKQAKPFTDYIGRCSYLLQQGLFAADVCYYNGDWTPNLVEPKHIDPALGAGYDYDACNAEVLLTRMTFRNGRIVLPDGMSYRLLVLPERKSMPMEVLQKLRDLVEAGATVVGPKPEKDSGLKNYPQCDQDVKRLADEVWGPCDGTNVTEHRFGNGCVVWGKKLRDVLMSNGVLPDFEYVGGKNTFIDFIHRRADDTEIYFLANRAGCEESVTCTFRVNGKLPEIWDPVTGVMRPAAAYTIAGGRTHVPLVFAPYGSMFVVFRTAAHAAQATGQNFATLKPIQELAGPWAVAFDTAWGGPKSVPFDRLVSWTKRPEEGIKFYSGAATYRMSFDLAEPLRQTGRPIHLDLGTVRNIAEVQLNGKSLGTVWTAPWRVDIAGVVKPAGNVLEITVINLWPNRLIGDAGLPKEKRLTKTNLAELFQKDQPLLESGLLGPVRLMTGD